MRFEQMMAFAEHGKKLVEESLGHEIDWTDDIEEEINKKMNKSIKK
jgi:hypothetical protein